MKTLTITCLIALLTRLNAGAQIFIEGLMPHHKYNISKKECRGFYNLETFSFTRFSYIDYALNGQDISPSNLEIDVLSYRKMFGNKKNLNVGAEISTLTLRKTENYPFVWQNTRDLAQTSFYTDVYSLNPLSIKLILQLFNTTPRGGYRTGFNLTPYPSLSLSIYSHPFSINYMSLPFTIFDMSKSNTKVPVHTTSEVNFTDGLKNIGLEVVSSLNKLSVAFGVEYNHYKTLPVYQESSATDNDYIRSGYIKSYKKPMPYLKFTVDLFKSMKSNVPDRIKMPVIEAEKKKILSQDGMQVAAITSFGEYTVEVLLSNKYTKVNPNITNAVITPPSDKIKISDVSLKDVGSGKSYYLRFRLQTIAAEPGNIKFPVTLNSGTEFYSNLNLLFTINPSDSFIQKLNLTDLPVITPSFNRLCMDVADEVARFKSSSNYLIYWPDDTRLGMYFSQLVAKYAEVAHMCSTKTKGGPCEALNPDYSITTQYTFDEKNKSINALIKIFSYRNGTLMNTFSKNIKIKDADELNWLKALKAANGEEISIN